MIIQKSVYGKNSPFLNYLNLMQKNFKLSISVNLSCTQVHFFEQKFKVPYRYFKVFSHKVVINSKIKNSICLFSKINMKLKRNKKKSYKNFKSYKIQEIRLGIGKYTLQFKRFL